MARTRMSDLQTDLVKGWINTQFEENEGVVKETAQQLSKKCKREFDFHTPDEKGFTLLINKVVALRRAKGDNAVWNSKKGRKTYRERDIKVSEIWRKALVVETSILSDLLDLIDEGIGGDPRLTRMKEKLSALKKVANRMSSSNLDEAYDQICQIQKDGVLPPEESPFQGLQTETIGVK